MASGLKLSNFICTPFNTPRFGFSNRELYLNVFAAVQSERTNAYARCKCCEGARVCVRGCVWIVPACERHACLSNNLKCVALLSRRPFFLDILCICSKEAEEGRKRQRESKNCCCHCRICCCCRCWWHCAVQLIPLKQALSWFSIDSSFGDDSGSSSSSDDDSDGGVCAVSNQHVQLSISCPAQDPLLAVAATATAASSYSFSNSYGPSRSQSRSDAMWLPDAILYTHAARKDGVHCKK